MGRAKAHGRGALVAIAGSCRTNRRGDPQRKPAEGTSTAPCLPLPPLRSAARTPRSASSDLASGALLGCENVRQAQEAWTRCPHRPAGTTPGYWRNRPTSKHPEGGIEMTRRSAGCHVLASLAIAALLAGCGVAPNGRAPHRTPAGNPSRPRLPRNPARPPSRLRRCRPTDLQASARPAR